MTRKTVGPSDRRRRRSQAASAAVDATLAEVVLDAQRRLDLRRAKDEADAGARGPSDARHGYLTHSHD